MHSLNSSTFAHIASKLDHKRLKVVYSRHPEYFSDKEVLFIMSKDRGYEIVPETFRDYFMLVTYDERDEIPELSFPDECILLAKYKRKMFRYKDVKDELFYFGSPFVKYLVANNIEGSLTEWKTYSLCIDYERLSKKKRALKIPNLFMKQP